MARLEGAVAERGAFRLGPFDLDLRPGERLAVTGRNGSGKSTLLGMLLGTRAARRRTRGRSGRARRIGSLEQARERPTTARTPCSTSSAPAPASRPRTRARSWPSSASAPTTSTAPPRSLSPGERTRAQLAELQSTGVNLLVLDEPTNHLDLEAIEQLEQALAGYDGTLVVVSHDRRFLEARRARRASWLSAADGQLRSHRRRRHPPFTLPAHSVAGLPHASAFADS